MTQVVFERQNLKALKEGMTEMLTIFLDVLSERRRHEPMHKDILERLNRVVSRGLIMW